MCLSLKLNVTIHNKTTNKATKGDINSMVFTPLHLGMVNRVSIPLGFGQHFYVTIDTSVNSIDS